MLEAYPYAQRQRLAYIDFSLLFRGSIYRNDLIQRFGVGLSAATRDFNLYKELAAQNLSYDTQQKRYFQTDQFQPIFEHDAQRTLVKLAYNISDGFDAIDEIQFPVESFLCLHIPNILIVAKVVQGILNRRIIHAQYTSLNGGLNKRELVPHDLVDNGLRWHVRAFDRSKQSYRDFVLTRFGSVRLGGNAPAEESAEHDSQWHQRLTLHLIPHPHNIAHKGAIESDYGMTNGKMSVEVRAAMAGYLLRRWNVDCTKDASLRGQEYQLLLTNLEGLEQVPNMSIAPGFDMKKDG